MSSEQRYQIFSSKLKLNLSHERTQQLTFTDILKGKNCIMAKDIFEGRRIKGK
jgi:hypothetical protein